MCSSFCGKRVSNPPVLFLPKIDKGGAKKEKFIIWARGGGGGCKSCGLQSTYVFAITERIQNV